MLSVLLKQGIETILMIVSITQEEINQIQHAHSKALFSHTEKKNNLISAFYTKRIIISDLAAKIKKDNPELGDDDCFSKEEISLFDELEKNLIELKKINRTYKRIVSGVGEFYLSMLEKLLPNQMNGYSNTTSLQNTFNISI